MPLSQEDVNACREAFNKFDKDGSGTVSVISTACGSFSTDFARDSGEAKSGNLNILLAVISRQSCMISAIVDASLDNDM